LLGILLAADLAGESSLLMSLALMLIVILMQSAANTLNDYYDFVKGTDRPENSNDPADAVLVYNCIDPAHVRALGFAFLCAAGALGAYVVAEGGLVPLAAGAAGGLAVIAYSAGKSPISYLPLGELLSGIAMGGLVPFAAFAAFTREARFDVLLYSLPCIIGVGLVMMTNNICDIERDRESGRKTLPALLGRERARLLYRALFIAMLLSLPVIAALHFRHVGAAMLPALLLGANVFRKQLNMPLMPDGREACMKGMTQSAVLAYSAYFSVIVADMLAGAHIIALPGL
ncbi:MAG: prenyltransferase, partial [Clostridiales Family XIII bacterium]|nr:prenyltransferase [Clostridiales Family XIII bacterium]